MNHISNNLVPGANLEAVNRALSVTVQKQEREITHLRRALLEAARKLELAGWRQSADMARDAAR